MSKTVLFVGSSSAAKSQAKALVGAFQRDEVEFLQWWDAFTPGRTLLQELDSIRGKVHGALLLFSPEHEATVRGNDVQMPNLNVLFEFGYFYGHFGPEKVAMLRYGELYLPSDLGGYIHISGSRHFRRNGVVRPGKRTQSEFGRWLESFDAQQGAAEKGLDAAVDKSHAVAAMKRRERMAKLAEELNRQSWMAR